MRKGAKRFITICLGILWVACSSPAGSLSPGLSIMAAKSFRPLAIKRVVVQPLRLGAFADTNQQYSSSVTRLLQDSFSSYTTLDVINSTSQAKVNAAWLDIVKLQEPDRSKAVLLGQRIKADATLYGIVNRLYTPKDKSAGSAAAAFNLWLVDSTSGQVLWSATYENHDQPLTDNLLRLPQTLKGGLSYRSGEELLRQGFNDAAKTMERLRKTSGQ